MMFQAVTFQALTFSGFWQMLFQQQAVVNLHTKSHTQSPENSLSLRLSNT